MNHKKTNYTPRLIQFGSEATLPKSLILDKNNDFQQIRNEGRYYRGRKMVIGILKVEDEDSKVGFIVSKKVHKRAVHRNRAKRYMREAYRLSRCKIVPGTRMVIIAKREILDAHVGEVQSELIYFLKKSGAWLG